MLDAQRHRKCPRPTDESLAAIAPIEDSTTSEFFGRLRYLAPSHVQAAIGDLSGVARGGDSVEITHWPTRKAQLVSMGESAPADVGVEPDVEVRWPGALICVEVKLFSDLSGADQLGKQLATALDVAEREGRDEVGLLFITPDGAEPALPRFSASTGRLAVDGLARGIRDALRSYVDAQRDLGGGDRTTRTWSAAWCSWHRLLGALREHHDAEDRRAVAVLHDLDAVLRLRGIRHIPFDGFSGLETWRSGHAIRERLLAARGWLQSELPSVEAFRPGAAALGLAAWGTRLTCRDSGER
ncbi:MAG: hypothetical protein JWM10_5481 [Myxococcaceae bacterium]|nr:hypothetical protein [Myxococcaceae bacterium]